MAINLKPVDVAVIGLGAAGGVAVLPVIFIDGELALKGAYPDSEQYTAWMNRARPPATA